MKENSMFRTIFGILLFVIVGCVGSSDPVSDPVSESNSESKESESVNYPKQEIFDPVADYKQFINTEFEKIRGSAKFSRNSEYFIDVRETDSLVSPLVGDCTVDILCPLVSEEFTIMASFRLNMQHGYQNGKWVMIRGQAVTIDTSVLRDGTGVTHSVAQKMIGNSYEFKSIKDLAKLFPSE